MGGTGGWGAHPGTCSDGATEKPFEAAEIGAAFASLDAITRL